MNLRVVSNIHWKLAMEKEARDPGGERISFRARAQSCGQCFTILRGREFGFDHQGCTLLNTRSEPDQRATSHIRMLAKNLLTRFGKKCSVLRFHTLNFPTAEPETPFCIDVSAVSHPMPCFPWRARIPAVTYLGCGSCGRCGVVRFRNRWAAHDDFTNLINSEFIGLLQRRDINVPNRNDFYSSLTCAATHAGTWAFERGNFS